MEEAQEIRSRIMNGFAINRIPQKARDEFIAFSEDEFCGDRGFALKFLWDFYTGVISSGIEHLESELLLVKKELAELKDKPKEENKPKPRMDGSVRS